VFAGKLGITYFVDMRIHWPAIRALVGDYSRTKAEKQDQPNWIGVGEGATGCLFVLVIERFSPPLVETLLEPAIVQADAQRGDANHEADGAVPRHSAR
jgi:hypothetical protein